MCGIAGIASSDRSFVEMNIGQMIEALKNRGPDNREVTILNTIHKTVGFGHARLSIIDTSTRSNQPYVYNNLIMVFNGEVYNYLQLRSDLILDGYTFNTDSDTEVVIKSFDRWGTDCFNKFIGMFSIAIFDKIAESITLVRDRIGVKPLYVYNDQKHFIFGSQLAAFKSLSRFSFEVSDDALKHFIAYGAVGYPLSIYKGIKKVKPGSFLIYDLKSGELETKEYWSIPYLSKDINSSIFDIKNILTESINLRTVSDVGYGLFMSAGVDSSLVAAILTRELGETFPAFTIGFHSGNDEVPSARKIAKILKIEHYFKYCSEQDALNVLDEYSDVYDEPFADSSAIPTIFLSKFSSDYIKVAMSADGGDELFSGYSYYKNFRQLSNLIRSYPKQFVHLLKYPIGIVDLILRSNRSRFLNDIYDEASPLSNIYNRFYVPKEIDKYVGAPTRHIISSFEQGRLMDNKAPQIFDMLTYLPDDILTKVDRASMRFSVEAREPLLDHRLVDAALNNNIDLGFQRSMEKPVLKKLLLEYLPEELVFRKKTGFSVPLGEWIRGPFRKKFESLFERDSILYKIIISKEALIAEYNLFLSKKDANPELVWRCLVFLLWEERWLS